MSQEYASIVLLKIDSASEGRKALKDVTSFNRSTTKAKQPVNTMNRLRIARGYRTSTKAVTFDLEVPIRKGDPEVDWESLRDSDEEFLITYERDDNGLTRQLVDCVINEVSESASEDGSMTMSVSGLALDDRKVS